MPIGGVNTYSSCLFRAGPLTFTVDSPNEDLVELAEELFCDLRTDHIETPDVDRFLLSRSDGEDQDDAYDLAGPVVGSMRALPLARALVWLVSGLSRAALDAEPSRLHLHAAAAERDGRAVVLAAPRETGKTSTVGRLALRGWTYLSDEAVSLGRDDGLLRGFPKPLSIKPGGRDLLPELTPHLLPRSGITDGTVLHSPLGPTGVEVCTAASPHLVVILERPADGHASTPPSIPLHPVDAVVALMSDAMDAGRFGADAVVELARLTARCHCHRVVVGDQVKTVAHIESLFTEPPRVPLGVGVLREGAWVNPSVLTVQVGDRVVLHEQPEGRVLAFDEAGSAIWLTIGGWRSDPDLNLSAPVVAQFVRTLVGLGFVDGDVLP